MRCLKMVRGVDEEWSSATVCNESRSVQSGRIASTLQVGGWRVVGGVHLSFCDGIVCVCLLLEFELKKLVGALLHEFALLRVICANAHHAKERQRLRVALPVTKQLDIGGIGEVGKLKAFVVFLRLFCNHLLELDLAFVRRPAWSSFCSELLQLVVVPCEKSIGDESVYGRQVWQSIDIIRQHKDESGQAIYLGVGGATADGFGVVELIFAMGYTCKLGGPSRVRMGWARLFLDGAF